MNWNWLKQLFGAKPRRVASGSLPLAALRGVGFGLSAHLKVAHDLDVEIAVVTNTNSMVPTLDANCVLLVERCPYESLTAGDIVTYHAAWNDGRLTCHRLNDQTDKGWWPLGDGNPRMDPEFVTPANFTGRVLGILYGQRTEETDR